MVLLIPALATHLGIGIEEPARMLSPVVIALRGGFHNYVPRDNPLSVRAYVIVAELSSDDRSCSVRKAHERPSRNRSFVQGQWNVIARANCT
jgi:hypothetical protein